MKRTRELDMATSAKLKRFSSHPDRVFTCKTCDRQFSSFQALGGHRASHNEKQRLAKGQRVVDSPKTHQCSICGLQFPIGQALGGHMRKHWNAATVVAEAAPVAVLNKCNSKRVLCLDLNLTPLENDLKLHFGFVL